jgi:CubicO group peptidase (beta-lactamase class C family)
MKKLFLLLFASLCVFKTSFGKDFIPKNPNIIKVENGLKYGIVIDNQKSMNILARMKELKVPNVSIAVINDGKIEWSKTYTLPGQPSISSHTLFQAASISKPVTAFLVMKYVQNGCFLLFENVNNYLSTWKLEENKYTEQDKVTLARILSHTAGLGVHGFDGYDSTTLLKNLPTLTQILNGDNPPANSPKVEVIGYPGKQYSYSGGGYLIAQKMLEDLTNQKFSDVAQESLLNPLGMTDSTYHYYYPKEEHPSIAMPHESDGTLVANGWHIYPESTPAGLWTTPTDLAKFVIEVQKSYEGKSNKILSKETVNKILTQQKHSPHGLGPNVTKYQDGVIEFQHGGTNEGFTSYMVGFTKNGQGAVIMTNSNNGQQLLAEIVRSIADTYSWHKGYTYQYQNIHPIPIDPSITQKIVGNYNLQEDALAPPTVVQIINENNKIYIQNQSGSTKYELTAASKTEFFNQEREALLKFLDKNYTQFVISGMTATKI